MSTFEDRKLAFNEASEGIKKHLMVLVHNRHDLSFHTNYAFGEKKRAAQAPSYQKLIDQFEFHVDGNPYPLLGKAIEIFDQAVRNHGIDLSPQRKTAVAKELIDQVTEDLNIDII